jgi:hypothetical protein
LVVQVTCEHPVTEGVPMGIMQLRPLGLQPPVYLHSAQQHA